MSAAAKTYQDQERAGENISLTAYPSPLLKMVAALTQEIQALRKEREADRKAQEENTRLMRQILQHVHATVKPYLSVEEALEVVGLNPTSKKHRRYLADACMRYKHGVRSIGRRPPRYYREDIERMAKDIREGQFIIMGLLS